MATHAYNSSYLGGKDGENCGLRLAWAKNMRPHLKNTKKQKTWGLAQVVEYLPSKFKIPSSSPYVTK
jgi:hypothetical protein